MSAPTAVMFVTQLSPHVHAEAAYSGRRQSFLVQVRVPASGPRRSRPPSRPGHPERHRGDDEQRGEHGAGAGRYHQVLIDGHVTVHGQGDVQLRF